MRLRMAVFATVIVCCSLPTTMEAQPAVHEFRSDVLRPAMWGGLAGLGLAFAYVAPAGKGWLVSDEAALPLALATGLGAAFLVRGASASVEPWDANRPRLWIAAGAGGAMDWDFALAYSTPLRERLTLGAEITIANDTWEKIETQTRCDVWGCITGDYLTDYRYQQSVSSIMRVAYALRPRAAWNPTLAFGGGPVTVDSMGYQEPESRHTGFLVNGALAVGQGTGNRRLAEAGFRITPLGARRETSIDDAAFYVRIGFGWSHTARQRG